MLFHPALFFTYIMLANALSPGATFQFVSFEPEQEPTDLTIGAVLGDFVPLARLINP